MSLAICSAVLLLAAGTDGPQLEASVGAGGGYNDNLDLAAHGQPSVASFGSATASAWANAGFSLDVASATRLYAGAGYDGVAYLDAMDLNRNAFAADLLLTQDLTESVAVIGGASFGHAWYGDSARNALELLGRATLRMKPRPWLALRVGYARVQSWASDSVFSIGRDRLLASVEARLARGSYLALGYSLSSGDQVFYQGAAGAAGMSGHRGSGMFASLAPYKASATEHTLSPSWEQRLWEELYMTLRYDHTWGSSQEGDYTVQSFFGGVGYRF
jgi:hypothetical protein